MTVPSVKNFQLITHQEGQLGGNIPSYVLQFGKCSDNRYKLDVQYPFSVFQAFGLALSVFECA